jgi:diguanylate cyclase (GGDEF)-like protein
LNDAAALPQNRTHVPMAGRQPNGNLVFPARMHKRFDLTLKWLGTVIVAIVVSLASLPYLGSREAGATLGELRHVAERERAYERLLALLKDAETGQRGYVITGDTEYLAPYSAARSALPAALQALSATAGADEAALLRDIAALSKDKAGELADTIRMRETGGLAAAAGVVSGGHGKQVMDRLRQLIGGHLAQLGSRRADLRARLEDDLERNAALALAAGALNTGMIGFALVLGGRTLRERAEAAQQARLLAAAQAAEALQVQARNRRLTVTAQMLQAIDSLTAVEELTGVLCVFLPRLLPGTTGAVYLYRNSRDYLERCAPWHAQHAPRVEAPELITPAQCWALRLGGPHAARGPDALRCPHWTPDGVAAAAVPGDPDQALCVPMVSQGEVIGLLTVCAPAADDRPLERNVVVTLAEQLALGISNIHLREVLRRQSTVDELTGLYNRRYFDEACRHELFRNERKHTPFALVMVDLDHFKRMNDGYGHDAGDLVLREVARCVQGGIRCSDIACRYGGEELVLLMPECDAGAAAHCADAIRRSVAALTLHYRDQALPPVTASFGVAAWPAHGADIETLLRAADRALYASKRAGRDRVTVA